MNEWIRISEHSFVTRELTYLIKELIDKRDNAWTVWRFVDSGNDYDWLFDSSHDSLEEAQESIMEEVI